MIVINISKINKERINIKEFILALILSVSAFGEMFVFIDHALVFDISNTLRNIIRITCFSYILSITLMLLIKEQYFKNLTACKVLNNN